MKNKNILWTIIGAIGTLLSCIAGCALFEQKKTEINRQVNAAVDKRFMQLTKASENNQQ